MTAEQIASYNQGLIVSFILLVILSLVCIHFRTKLIQKISHIITIKYAKHTFYILLGVFYISLAKRFIDIIANASNADRYSRNHLFHFLNGLFEGGLYYWFKTYYNVLIPTLTLLLVVLLFMNLLKKD